MRRVRWCISRPSPRCNELAALRDDQLAFVKSAPAGLRAEWNARRKNHVLFGVEGNGQSCGVHRGALRGAAPAKHVQAGGRRRAERADRLREGGDDA
jgi:hypothetical protein